LRSARQGNFGPAGALHGSMAGSSALGLAVGRIGLGLRASLTSNQNKGLGTVYRSASGTPASMTPRPQDAKGLSASINLDSFPSGSKIQAIDTSKLTNLCAVCDNPKTGHVSISPKDTTQMQGWIDSRTSPNTHSLTQELMNAVTGVIKK
jgi:hypothetical protein